MADKNPLAIELFCGTFGWSAGWLARGGRAIGFDLEHLPHHGDVPEGAELVLQDVLTLDGAQFKDADVIFASPPCQKYSWLAMPWSRSKDPENSKAAKALRKEWETNGPDNRLFDACFRIQREAIAATQKTCTLCAGSGVEPNEADEECYTCDRCGGIGWTERRYIPLIVENVRGAQEWVGRSRANYGSFHLYGDVAQVGNRIQMGADIGRFGAGLRIPSQAHPPKRAMDDLKYGVRKLLHEHLPVGTGPLGRNAPGEGVKVPSESGRRTDVGKGARFTSRDCGVEAGTKIGGDWFRDSACHSAHGSKSSARKAASALIARIPPELSDYAAQALWPPQREEMEVLNEVLCSPGSAR